MCRNGNSDENNSNNNTKQNRLDEATAIAYHFQNISLEKCFARNLLTKRIVSLYVLVL